MKWDTTIAWIKKNWPIYEYRLQGLSYRQIAKRQKVTWQNVQQVCDGMEGYEKALGARRLRQLIKENEK